MTSKPKATEPQPQGSPCPVADFYSAAGYDPGQSTGYLMRQIINSVSAEVSRQLEPKGLTNAQWMPMFKLYLGHVSTVAELARVCQLDAGSMTRMLDRLEAKGFLRRVRSSDDRRVVNLELTDSGREAAREIPAVLSRVQNAHLSGFSFEEWQTLKGLLRRVLDNAQNLQLPLEKNDEQA